MAGRPVPGALNIGDGGGKEESRLLGCGLEKRPPYPRPFELVGEAPTFGRRVSLVQKTFAGIMESVDCDIVAFGYA
jgi:hypothetical protein